MADPTSQRAAPLDLKAVLDAVIENVMMKMNCHAVATVESFNSTRQTVSASINYKKAVNGALVEYPVLVDCPVIMLSGGNAHLTLPIAKGDTCLILFNDRAIDAWYASGQVSGLPSKRMHAFADGIALVGLRSLQNVLSTFDTTRAVLAHGTTLVGVSATRVKIANDTLSLAQLLQNLITALSTLSSGLAGASNIAAVNAAGAAAVTALSTVSTQTSGLLE